MPDELSKPRWQSTQGRCLPRAKCDEIAEGPEGVGPGRHHPEPSAFVYLYKIAHFGSSASPLTLRSGLAAAMTE
jgi:hypothetical protein